MKITKKFVKWEELSHLADTSFSYTAEIGLLAVNGVGFFSLDEKGILSIDNLKIVPSNRYIIEVTFFDERVVSIEISEAYHIGRTLKMRLIRKHN